MRPGSSDQGTRWDAVLNVTWKNEDNCIDVGLERAAFRHVFSVAIGKGPPAQHPLRDPESCSSQCQPAENVAVAEGLPALAA